MSSAREIFKFVQTSLRTQERALMSVETMLDRMPGVVLLLTSDLRLLRVNSLGCTIFGEYEDELVGRSVQDLLSVSTVESLKTLIESVGGEDFGISRTVEIAMQARDKRELGNFSIRVSRVESPVSDRSFYVLVASDLAEIISLRTQMRTLFAEINGAVLVLNPDYMPDSPNFQAVDQHLGVSLPQIRTTAEIWDQINVQRLEADVADAWKKLPFMPGASIKRYEEIRDKLPTKIWLSDGRTGTERCFKLTITAIGVETIERIVVFFQDVTAQERHEIERVRLEDAMRRGRERERQVQSLADNLIATVLRELGELNSRMLKTSDNKDIEGLSRIMHGFKGNARCMGFARLASDVQNVEMEINKRKGAGVVDWEVIRRGTQDVNVEWTALSTLLLKRLEAVDGAGKSEVSSELFSSLNTLSFSSTKEKEGALEELLMKFALLNEVNTAELLPVAKMQAQDTRERLGKACDFSVKVDEIDIDKRVFHVINEALAHLISNSIKHGIEEPSERLKSGKPPVGSVRCTIRIKDFGLQVDVCDDGKGIDTARVKWSALQKGLITQDQAETMSDEAANLLIFHAGLSTASEVSMVAGLGVGLHAVMKASKEMKGRINVVNRPGKGAEFTIWLPRYAVATAQKFNSLNFFLSAFKKSLDPQLNVEVAPEFARGAFGYFGVFDASKLTFAFNRIHSRLTEEFKTAGQIRVQPSIDGAGWLEISMGFPGNKTENVKKWRSGKEWSYAEEILRVHGGALDVDDEEVRLRMFKTLATKSLPTLVMRSGAGDSDRRKASIKLLADIVSSEGLNARVDDAPLSGFEVELGPELMDRIVSEPFDVVDSKERLFAELPHLAMLNV